MEEIDNDAMADRDDTLYDMNEVDTTEEEFEEAGEDDFYDEPYADYDDGRYDGRYDDDPNPYHGDYSEM